VFPSNHPRADRAGLRTGQPARFSYRTDLGFYHLAALLPVILIPSLRLDIFLEILPAEVMCLPPVTFLGRRVVLAFIVTLN
jgi:hypothetical protein